MDQITKPIPEGSTCSGMLQYDVNYSRHDYEIFITYLSYLSLLCYLPMIRQALDVPDAMLSATILRFVATPFVLFHSCG